MVAQKTRRARTARRFVGFGMLAALMAAALWFRPDRALQVATGVVADTLCSEVFVSGQEPDQVYAQVLLPTPGLNLLTRLMHYTVDHTQKEVRADLAGVFASRSVDRGVAGCRLIPADAPVPPPPHVAPIATPALLPDIAGPAPVAPADSALAAALDHVFAEPETGPPAWVKTIVVVKDGQVIAERYAPGIGIDTPLLGYSLSKTTINALIGILVGQGKLQVDAPAPVGAWADPASPRHAITLDNLLRMTSGLAAEESDNSFDPTSRMLYIEPDMAAFAERAGLKRPPGTVWEYASPNTLILSRIIKDAVGGTEADVLNFARSTLFGPLGMKSVVFETDSTGTPIGSTSMLASARDWAKLGLLYLNDGVVGGKRLFPEGWVAYSRRSTLGTSYGAGLWTNDGQNEHAQERIRSGMPADAFYASGRLGQRVYIMPSQQLVIVRLGITQQPGFGISGDLRLIREVIAATAGPHT
jgi:CubicO group peptidase (beta-lactamase class C family)